MPSFPEGRHSGTVVPLERANVDTDAIFPKQYGRGTARQGFYWWEFDPTYYGLKVMSWMGLIWGLKGVPDSVYEEAERTKAEDSSQRA